MGLLDKALSKKKESAKSEELKTKTIEKKEQTSPQEAVKKENKLEYKTDLDKIYHLVQTSGSVPLKNIPKILHISLEDAEKFAKILSKDNLILLVYPAIGSPELRKKDFVKRKKPKKITKVFKNKKIILIIIVLIVVIFGIIAIRSIFKNDQTEIKFEVSDVTKDTSQISGNEVTLGTAFSGEGDYKCEFEKDDIAATYYIKDEKMRVETMVNGKNNIVIINDGFTYTYLETSEKWTKVKTLETTVRPGSGKVPAGAGISISCFESKLISNDQFEEGELV